tara:strand:+ start:35593 stop:36354 length:762 start_codon:yes stop_codon:yes gene_type:complete
MIVIDIETKPIPELVEKFIKPLPAFDQNEVKFGNTKDPEKRAALVASKQAEHDDATVAHMAKAKDRAALNPLTAQVLVIGLYNDHAQSPEHRMEFLEGNEKLILSNFWSQWYDTHLSTDRFVFWSGSSNSENFDPDMLIRRSWILGVKVPPQVINGRYLGSRWEDAAQRYMFGRFNEYCGLSRAAEELGLFGDGAKIFPKSKDDTVTGANFWQWYENKMTCDAAKACPSQKTLAMSYLTNDLLILDAIAGRIY